MQSSSLSDPSQVQVRIQKDGNEFGNKAANLKELERLAKIIASDKLKVQIPEINPIGHTVIHDHLSHHAPQWQSLWDEFVKAQGKEQSLQPKAIVHLKSLQTLIKKTFKEHPVIKEVDRFAHDMSLKNANLMVRSTGKEDDVVAANPGGNTSVAAVKPDVNSISEAIGVVIASYFSEKSLKQRLLSPPPANDITQTPFMPVLLQRMIGEKVHQLKKDEITKVSSEKKELKDAKESKHSFETKEIDQIDEASASKKLICSGVMYTNEGKITIQVAPGHGELIVNSKAPFDTFFLSRDDYVYPTIYKKVYRLAPTPDEHERKLSFVKNTKELQNSPAIPNEKVLEIGAIGRLIETHYGMPMDVELVYNPEDEVIYLVQARPIPKGERGKLKPSSFPPDKIPEIRQDKTINIAKASVISPADHAAKVIVKKPELLNCENLETALNYYLAQKKSPVKSTIVKNMAPSTSHEAAQFNAKAIPVLQYDDPDQIEEWMKKDKFVLIVDPQRNQIVDWTNKVKDYENVEEELYKDKVLERGRFRSPLPPKVTVYPTVPFKEKIKPIFQSNWSDELKRDAKDTIVLNAKKPYSELEHMLEVLEAAKAGDKNEAAQKALLSIQFHIYRLAKHKKNDPLFQQAVVFCNNLKKGLLRFSKLDKTSDIEKEREEWLDLVSKVSALIVNRGESLLFSDSIYQRAQDIKDEKYAKQAIPSDVKLDERQFTYFKEFIKLKKIILDAEGQQQWTRFIADCCENREYTKRLKQIIQFIKGYNIESDVLNVIFTECVNEKLATKHILLKLGKECANTKEQLDAMQLEQSRALIQGWVNRCSEWSNPNEFDQLYKEYIKEINSLITKLTIDKNTTRMVKKAILKTVQELTDMMDTTIKAMKGSPEYQTDEQISLQVKRFILLLEPYHELMQTWLQQIDTKQFDKWEEKVRAGLRSGKDYILNQIRNRFNKLKYHADKTQLNPSGKFSVDSARIGSSASFYLQFVWKVLTLEDMFTLFHQNILASTIFLGKDSQIKQELLSKDLQPILEHFANAEGSKKIDLLGIEHNYPLIRLEFNLPLRNHAAKFVFEYNQINHGIKLKTNFFGNNIGNYMSKACKLASQEGLLLESLGVHTKQHPTYNHSSFNLEFVWEWNASENVKLIPLFKKAFLKYGQIPFGGEDTKTLFSYLKNEERFNLLITGAEGLLLSLKGSNKNIFEKNNLLISVITQIQEINKPLTKDEHIRIANLFISHLQIYINVLNKGLTTKATHYADVLLKKALEHVNFANASISETVETKHLKLAIVDMTKEIEVKAKLYNNEARILTEHLKQKLTSVAGTKIIKLLGGKEIASNLKHWRTGAHAERLLHQIHLAERGKMSYVDVLHTRTKSLLSAAKINRYFTAKPIDTTKSINDVLQFSILTNPAPTPNEVIKNTMNAYLNRKLGSVRNKFKHTDNLAREMIGMTMSGQEYKEIIEYAEQQYTGKGGHLSGGRMFAYLLNLLKSVYLPSVPLLELKEHEEKKTVPESALKFFDRKPVVIHTGGLEFPPKLSLI